MVCDHVLRFSKHPHEKDEAFRNEIVLNDLTLEQGVTS